MRRTPRRSRPVASAPEDVRAALQRPDFYPGRLDEVVVRETHISWVFLAGDRAYKLKKPVVMPFLDYGTPHRRRDMCREEVRLNRRLAPDIYLGVRSVAAVDGELVLSDDDDPEAVDYVVEMRRYDEDATMAAKLARGELKRAEVITAAQLLARFHAQAPRVRASGVPALAVERRMTENFHELLAIVEQRAEVERVLELERFAHDFAVAHAHTLDVRARRGRLRDGHGDVRAEHVLLDGEPQIVDCLEFDPALRALDVADELAFLVMDLTARGGGPLADVLVDAYRAAGGDPGEDWLIAFYAAYRALVQAKVALVRAAQHPSGSAAHGHDSAVARDMLGLAERYAWRARRPLVVVVCGVPASGKSQLAHALAEASGLPHLSSDVTRKRLAGLKPAERAPDHVYTPDFNRLTYAALGRRSAGEAAEQGGAIVDATFRHRADRDAFGQSFAHAAPLLFVECRVPAHVQVRWAAQRDRRPMRVSDASLAVASRERASWEPLDEVPAEAHVILRSDRPAEGLVADLVGLIDRRIARLAVEPEDEPA